MAQQEGMESLKDKYFDIMLVGMTGQGKSTMADKLLIANPGKVKYVLPEEPKMRVGDANIQMEDISMWVLQERHEKDVETYLKALVHSRTKLKPHTEMNNMRDPQKNFMTSTSFCEVFSNDTTKVRVLDAPGFVDKKAFSSISSMATPTSQSTQAANNITAHNFGIMQNIIRIQLALGMRFRRVVYFLPCRGPLERENAVLEQQLQQLEYAFGHSVFECMVVVATIPRRYSLREEETMPQEEIEQCKHFFQAALGNVIGPNEAKPDVPIIFVSLAESCESILGKIQGAGVSRDGLELRSIKFSICASCGMKIGSLGKERIICSGTQDLGWSIPYEESTCHPAFNHPILSYTPGSRIKDAISKVWPLYIEEYCKNCGRKPGQAGCLQIGENYRTWWKVYTVDHICTVRDPIEEPMHKTGQSGSMTHNPTDQESRYNSSDMPWFQDNTIFSTSLFGIKFFGEPVREEGITWRGATIQLPTTGICVTIPEHSLGGDETVDFLIHPCFSGPFELPTGYESASPAYLIHPSRKVAFCKPVTLQIRHFTSLTSKVDCEEMEFFSANPTPQYTKNSPHSPVYIFKNIRESRGIFKTNSQIAEIQLTHFCLMKAGRKTRWEQQTKETIGNATFYSARLYRSVTSEPMRASAVFCMCPDQPLYTTHCNQRIAAGYTAMSDKEEARSVIRAKLTDDEISLSVTSPEGWSTTFDKEPTKIMKRDLDAPEYAVTELTDYPPKFLIHINQAMDQVRADESPKLVVKGLDIENCSFPLVTPSDSPMASPGTPQHTETLNPSEQSRPDATYTLSYPTVMRQLAKINRKWDSLGMALGLEPHEIQVIQINHSGDVKKCLGRVIEEWLKWNGKEVSWKTMYEALRDPLVSRPNIAGEIKQKYLEPS